MEGGGAEGSEARPGGTPARAAPPSPSPRPRPSSLPRARRGPPARSLPLLPPAIGGAARSSRRVAARLVWASRRPPGLGLRAATATWRPRATRRPRAPRRRRMRRKSRRRPRCVRAARVRGPDRSATGATADVHDASVRCDRAIAARRAARRWSGAAASGDRRADHPAPPPPLVARARPQEELSPEDLALKENLDMLVERVLEDDEGVAIGASKAIGTELRCGAGREERRGERGWRWAAQGCRGRGRGSTTPPVVSPPPSSALPPPPLAPLLLAPPLSFPAPSPYLSSPLSSSFPFPLVSVGLRRVR